MRSDAIYDMGLAIQSIASPLKQKRESIRERKRKRKRQREEERELGKEGKERERETWIEEKSGRQGKR